MKWEHTGTLKKEELSRMLRSMADALEKSNEFESFIGSTKLSMEASDQFNIAVQLIQEGDKFNFGLSLAWMKPSKKIMQEPSKSLIQEDEGVVRTVRGKRRKKRPSILGSKKIPVLSTAHKAVANSDVYPHVTEELPQPTSPPTPPPIVPEPEEQAVTIPPEPVKETLTSIPESKPQVNEQERKAQPQEPQVSPPLEEIVETVNETVIPEPPTKETVDWRKALDEEMEASGFISSAPEPSETPEPSELQEQLPLQPSRKTEVLPPTRIHEQPVPEQPVITSIPGGTALELVLGTYESAFTMKPESEWYELDLSDEQLESIKYKKLAEEVLSNQHASSKKAPPSKASKEKDTKSTITSHTSPSRQEKKTSTQTDVEELFAELDDDPPKKSTKKKTSGIDENTHLVKPSEFLKRKNK